MEEEKNEIIFNEAGNEPVIEIPETEGGSKKALGVILGVGALAGVATLAVLKVKKWKKAKKGEAKSEEEEEVYVDAEIDDDFEGDESCEKIINN